MRFASPVAPWRCLRCGREYNEPRHGGVCTQCHRTVCRSCLVMAGPRQHKQPYCRDCAVQIQS